MAKPGGSTHAFMCVTLSVCVTLATGWNNWNKWNSWEASSSAKPAKCYLPAMTGVCRAYFPSYYYDADRGVCGCFVYGGCQGNANRFNSLAECSSECKVSHSDRQDPAPECRDIFGQADFQSSFHSPQQQLFPSLRISQQHNQQNVHFQQHPPLATQHPPLATQHPPLATQHPPLATQHPPLATQHPPLATQHPPQALQHPPQALQHPPQALQHPPQATHHPPQATQHPPLATHHHVTAVYNRPTFYTTQGFYVPHY